MYWQRPRGVFVTLLGRIHQRKVGPTVLTMRHQDEWLILVSIYQQHPDSRVLCLFWDWTPQQVHSALLAGAAGCLEAHLTTADFVTALRQVSRDEIVLSPDLQRAVVLDMLGTSLSQKEADFNELSPREQEVLELLCKGLSNKQIAQRLYLSVRTIKNHLARLYNKLGVHNRTKAAVLAMQQGRAA